jgi:hypothetical protein
MNWGALSVKQESREIHRGDEEGNHPDIQHEVLSGRLSF